MLDPRSPDLPSVFAIDLILDGTRWQYGFEVDDREVQTEYAYHYPNGRQSLVFIREGQRFKFGRSLGSFGRSLEGLCRENSLLLSVSGAAHESILTPLYAWFRENLILADTATRDLRTARTVQLLQDPVAHERVLHLLRAADLGITDIEIETITPDPEMQNRLRLAQRILSGEESDQDAEESSEPFVHEYVQLRHCGDNGCDTLDPSEESTGTLVWLGVIGSILDALDNGAVLLADELDSSLHPHLVQRLVRLFQDPATNRRSAQLIFNAHDVTVLGDSSQRILSRDQIWFTEKESTGSTSLFALSGFNPRKDDALQRRYLQGRYGAIPSIDDGGLYQAAQPVNA